MPSSPSTTSTPTRTRVPSRTSRSRRCATSATSCGRSSMRSISLTCSPDGLRPARFAFRKGVDVAPPSDTSQPRLAAGCRWGGTEQDRVILFPEGAIKLQGTARQVLERCDGQRTSGDIIAELQKEFGTTDPEKIRADISAFLEQLQKKRIVDY